MADLWLSPWLEGNLAKTTAANFHLDVLLARMQIILTA